MLKTTFDPILALSLIFCIQLMQTLVLCAITCRLSLRLFQFLPFASCLLMTSGKPCTYFCVGTCVVKMDSVYHCAFKGYFQGWCTAVYSVRAQVIMSQRWSCSPWIISLSFIEEKLSSHLPSPIHKHWWKFSLHEEDISLLNFNLIIFNNIFKNIL